jgi:translocation and assembly module TamB
LQESDRETLSFPDLQELVVARSNIDSAEYTRPNTGRSTKRSWFKKLLLIGTFVLLAVVAFAPTLLSSASLANWVVASFAGLAPLKLEMSSLQLGWLRPVGVEGIKITDESGQTIATVASIKTDKSLLGWITNQTDLGTIRVDGSEALIVAGHGTTNLEQILAGLLEKNNSNPEPESDDSSPMPRGTFEVTNTRLHLNEQGRPEQWVIDIANLQTQLPETNQLFGPTQIQARISQVSGTTPDTPGEIVADAQQTADGSIQLRAKLTQLPLEIMHVLHARLPHIQVEEAAGRVSGVLVGVAASADKFTFELQQLQVQNLAVQAPALVGPTPARMNNLSLGGQVSLADGMMRIHQTDLACDFARVQASADLPWPVQLPTINSPFITGATVQAAGQVDLPQLIAAAQTLIPMRPDTQLRAGSLQFSVSQQSGPEASAKATAILSGLEAQAAGQQIRWSEPLTLELSAVQQSNGPQFGVAALAEFCNVRGNGTIENGKLEGQVNLDLLQQRLSQFVQLPLTSMNGNANLNMQWEMNANEQVTASGTLKTSPITIATLTGAQMNEPAWQGTFGGLMQLKGGTPAYIHQFQLQMLAADEQLTVEMQDPLQLTSTTGATAALAGFSVSLTGNLANLKHRAMVWLTQPPEMQVEGIIKLTVAGKLDTAHAEILQADWDVQPLRVSMADFAMAEPQVVGKFTGRVDTADLTKLQIEQLTVQSSSFSLLAKDQAAAPNSRRGQATCFVDLNRLMNNVQMAGSPTNAASRRGDQPVAAQAPAAQYSATGQLQAGLAWLVSADGAEFRTQVSGKDVALTSRAATDQAPSALWSEPQLNIAADGRWLASSGVVNISQLQMQAPWINYQGKLDYVPSGTAQDLNIVGQAVYDANQLATRIAPLTGNNVQMAGQYTMPIEVAWHRDSTDTQSSALAGLRARSRIGWEQARVIGIELGKADVPVDIQAGQLTSAAEIPVSGGMLRWDITSDLTRDLLVIEQKPMTVLENVAITREMCSGWLKYVAPLMAEATSIDGRLSLGLSRAQLTPTNLAQQTVEGQLVMHNAEVGPGPLSSEIMGIIKQIDAIRKPELTQSVSAQNKVWLHLPEQRIDFAMLEGRVHHKNVRVDIGDATITTAGSVDVAGQLQLVASMPIPDKWTEKGPVMAALRGQVLQFPVRGSISRPQVDSTALAQFGRQAAESAIQNAAQNAIQKQLNKGLDKLFK